MKTRTSGKHLQHARTPQLWQSNWGVKRGGGKNFIYLKITTFKISQTKRATNYSILCKIKRNKKTEAADNIGRKIATIVAYTQALCARKRWTTAWREEK